MLIIEVRKFRGGGAIILSDAPRQISDEDTVASLTKSLLHKFYCENEIDTFISLIDEPFSWFGIGEDEYTFGREEAGRILRKYVGKVPECSVLDEEYHAVKLASQVFLCTGRAWITTTPESGMVLRSHQRFSLVFRKIDGKFKCSHTHFSNPSHEMYPGERLFPTQLAQQSSEYLEEYLQEQQQRLEEQAAELESIYNDAPCAIMVFLRTKDGEYKLLSANDATARMAHVDPHAPWRTNWENGYCGHVAAEYVDDVRHALTKLVNPGDRVEVTYRLEVGTDEEVYVNAINSFIRQNNEGDIIQRIVVDVTDRVRLERALRQKSIEDPLTGVYNRTKFNEEMFEHHHEKTTRIGIAYFDINGLKRMNDEFGHAAGDDLIIRTTSHIDNKFPGQVYRIGGDEFVVIAPEIDKDEFEQRVRELCDDLKADNISAAVGVSWRLSGCSITEQFEEADHLMYEDKARHYKEAGHDRRSHRE